MSPVRSLLGAGSLTALVLAAVLVVGAHHGAFGLHAGSPSAAATTGARAGTQDPPVTVPAGRQGRPSDRDDRQEWDDEHDGRESRGPTRSVRTGEHAVGPREPSDD
jgi:hypothetical protein